MALACLLLPIAVVIWSRMFVANEVSCSGSGRSNCRDGNGWSLRSRLAASVVETPVV